MSNTMTDRDFWMFVAAYAIGFLFSFATCFWFFYRTNEEKGHPKHMSIFEMIVGSAYMSALSWISYMFLIHLIDDIDNTNKKTVKKEKKKQYKYYFSETN